MFSQFFRETPKVFKNFQKHFFGNFHPIFLPHFALFTLLVEHLSFVLDLGSSVLQGLPDEVRTIHPQTLWYCPLVVTSLIIMIKIH